MLINIPKMCDDIAQEKPILSLVKGKQGRPSVVQIEYQASFDCHDVGKREIEFSMKVSGS